MVSGMRIRTRECKSLVSSLSIYCLGAFEEQQRVSLLAAFDIEREALCVVLLATRLGAVAQDH